MKAKILDFSSKNKADFLVNENESQSYILLSPEGDISFIVKDNSYLKLAIVNQRDNDALIKGVIGNNSRLEVYYADFLEVNNHLKTDIDLAGEHASIYWHLASLSKGKGKKAYEVSVSHSNLDTKSQIDNYGICKDEAKLNFSGIVHIKNGAHQSVAHQNAKIIIFDDDTDAIAKPILKIDDNDIEASHASSVGKISDDELFYLTSRGINMDTARELITFGYLKPIISGFDDEEIAKQLTGDVEGGF
ncbi:MAG: SufD family Fe-S cluster assembly protein [Bacilli bacterium]|nr:SufD family Fe-S cluster assembly protein [Bacilli bacterium]